MKKVIVELQRKHNLSIEDIQAVINAAEYCLADAIKSSEFKNIRLPAFGLFYVEPKALEKIEKLNLKKKNETL